MKKIISLMLVLIMMLSVSITAFANTEDAPSSGEIMYNSLSEQINGEKISKVDNIEYYMDYTDDYNITIGKLSNGKLDVSYYDKVNGMLYHSFLENEYTKIAEDKFYSTIKNNILNGKVKLETIDQNNFTSSTVLRSSTHGDFIWAELEARGWDDPGTSLFMSETRNGDEGKIDLTTSYSYNDRISIFSGTIGTTAGVVAAWLGIDVQKAISIGTFVYSVAQAVYVLAFDQNFEEYNVYAYENKYVYVNDTYQYQAGRTVKWVAACGDSNATFTFKSNNYVYDFYDNDGLMDTGFYNYYNNKVY